MLQLIPDAPAYVQQATFLFLALVVALFGLTSK